MISGNLVYLDRGTNVHREHGKLNRIFGKFVRVWCARSRLPIKCELACDGGWPRERAWCGGGGGKGRKGAEGAGRYRRGRGSAPVDASRRRDFARVTSAFVFLSFSLATSIRPSICLLVILVKNFRANRGVELNLPFSRTNVSAWYSQKSGRRHVTAAWKTRDHRRRNDLEEWHLRTRIFAS